MDMSIDLLDPDFEPSVTAQVEAVIKSPSGKLTNLKLPSSLDVEGRFGMDFLPEEVGEYSVNVKVEFADETKMSKKVSFLASEASGENGTLPLNKRLLEDVARITGGDYIHWDSEGKEITLSEKIPVNQTRTYYFNGAFTLAAILLLFCGEWYLRRRIGLR